MSIADLRGSIFKAALKEVIKEVQLPDGTKIKVLFIEQSYGKRQNSIAPFASNNQKQMEQHFVRSGQLAQLIDTAHDPDTRKPLFDATDKEALGGLPAAVLDALILAMSEAFTGPLEPKQEDPAS
jgi:hypothetical protein